MGIVETRHPLRILDRFDQDGVFHNFKLTPERLAVEKRRGLFSSFGHQLPQRLADRVILSRAMR